MMVSLEAWKKAFEHLPEGAVEAEVNAETHDYTSVTVENGELADVEYCESTALYVRVSGEKTGYAYTQDATEDPAALIALAYENSRYSEQQAPEAMNRNAEVKDFGTSPAVSDVKELARIANEIAAAVNAKLKNIPGGFEAGVSLYAETYGQHTVNSHGLDVSSYNPLYILDVGDAHGANQEMGMASVNRCASSIEAFDLDEISASLADCARWQQNAVTGFQSGMYPVILSNSVTCTILSTAWQLFAAHKYVDDATALAGMLGKKVAGECLSLSDYPTVHGQGYPMFCDAEGTEGKPVHIVENGVFTHLISNNSTAEKLGMESTGNAGRRPLMFGNIATDILVTPKNFYVEPGTASVQELEEHMGNGLLITDHFDIFHSLNISSGDFSIPCFAVKIENGKEAGLVQALVMSGNIRDLLNGVVEVGNDPAITPMDGTHSYGVGACTLRIDGVMVSGE